jgi:hypothetical protein
MERARSASGPSLTIQPTVYQVLTHLPQISTSTISHGHKELARQWIIPLDWREAITASLDRVRTHLVVDVHLVLPMYLAADGAVAGLYNPHNLLATNENNRFSQTA